MEKLIITGETGSGKTFFAINKCEKPFIYLAPCRQLVYEVAQDYGKMDDAIMTGECHKKGKLGSNCFAVYESAISKIEKYKSIIIDEAHFLTDCERGQKLAEIIEKAISKNINIYLVTATNTIADEYLTELGFSKEFLKSKFKIPIRKELDSYLDFWQKAKEGHKSIYFVRYKSDAYRIMKEAREEGLNAEELTADTSASKRLDVQNKFRDGQIDVIISTNVIAQGLNFPCSNVLIEYNPYDPKELIAQKLGRLGRPNMYDGEEVFYYCHSVISTEFNKKNPPIEKRGSKIKLNWTTEEIEEYFDFYDQSGNNRNNLKYAIDIIRKHKKIIKEEFKKQYLSFLNEVLTEERKLLKIIKKRLKK